MGEGSLTYNTGGDADDCIHICKPQKHVAVRKTQLLFAQNSPKWARSLFGHAYEARELLEKQEK